MSLNREEKDFLKKIAVDIVKANMELMASHERRMDELTVISRSHRQELETNIAHLRNETGELRNLITDSHNSLKRDSFMGLIRRAFRRD